MKPKITPRDVETPVNDNDLIVSKTDTRGRITYANRTFMRICGYYVRDLLGTQHNIIRHPDMPRGVFRLLWQVVESGEECFAYVKNLCADGSYYWVFANVTPDRDMDGRVRGYFSVRRRASAEAVRTMIPIYQQMLAVERQAGSANAPDASLAWLHQQLKTQHTDYAHFILTLG